MVSDLEVWRAAQQMIDLYPDDPIMATAQRADSAYEQGDIFNFNLWSRVNRAVVELIRQTPSEGEPVN
jgi:hypothetical protein